MTDALKNALLDLRARQEAGEKMPCPRCGRDTMKPMLVTNALSRHADGIYVCDDCGSAEAMLDFMRNPLPTECWAFLRKQHSDLDFTSLSSEAAWQQIKEDHLPKLMDIFKRWHTGDGDFRALRSEAFLMCPGLTQIWEQPFQTLYSTGDGDLILRFRMVDDRIEVAVDLLNKGK